MPLQRLASLDQLIAADPVTGRVLPRRPGETWLFVSAGGWRTDAVRFTVAVSAQPSRFLEGWTDAALGRWQLYGDPKPQVSAGGGRPAFSPNGDKTFESGALTRSEFPAANGLGFEAAILAPLSRPKWQNLRIQLGRVAMLDATGAHLDGCRFELPAGEGREYLGQVTFASPLEELHLPATPRLTDGRWHRVRIQVFPDRTCGFAIDGQPVLRLQHAPPELGSLRLALSGQSVGAKLLVGAVEMWEGVKTDIDWAKLERK